MNFQEEIDTAIKGKRLYFLGEQLPPDWYAGFRQWSKLAENGDAKACFNVGRCYQRGDGIDQNLDQAKDWFHQAIKLGETRSYFNLYTLHKDAKFAALDDQVAEQMLGRAATAQDPRALKELANREQAQRDALAEAQYQAKQKEEKRFQDASWAAQSKFADCISRGNMAEARSLARAALESNYRWAKDAVAIADLVICVKGRGIALKEKTSITSFWLWQGSTQSGTTHYFYFNRWCEISIKNPSEFPVIFLGNYPAIEIKPNGSEINYRYTNGSEKTTRISSLKFKLASIDVDYKLSKPIKIGRKFTISLSIGRVITWVFLLWMAYLIFS